MISGNPARPSQSTGSVNDRIGPGFRRSIHDIYSPDASCDERLDDLIEQLRQVPWVKAAQQ